jgi:hypothetical protein
VIVRESIEYQVHLAPPHNLCCTLPRWIDSERRTPLKVLRQVFTLTDYLGRRSIIRIEFRILNLISPISSRLRVASFSSALLTEEAARLRSRRWQLLLHKWLCKARMSISFEILRGTRKLSIGSGKVSAASCICAP